jgi:hypothetical protein
VNAFCGATTRYADPRHQPVPVAPQTVTCVRNTGHKGQHSGVAKDVDGDAVFHHWTD